MDEHLGGLCYQLNLTFAALLKAIGFNISIHAAVLKSYEQSIFDTPRMTHIVPVVHLREQRF